jgi:hypothetical protein
MVGAMAVTTNDDKVPPRRRLGIDWRSLVGAAAKSSLLVQEQARAAGGWGRRADGTCVCVCVCVLWMRVCRRREETRAVREGVFFF